MKSFLGSILCLIQPPRCVLCGGITNSTQLCKGCVEEELLPHDSGHRCIFCFSPVFEEKICELCEITPSLFIRQRMLWDFSPAVRELIHEMKFRKNSTLCYSVGKFFAPYLLEYFDGTEWDYIVPVPLHRKRIAERGYNQSDYICAGITRALFERSHLRRERILLRRVRDTPKQSLLKQKRRETNLKDAFSCRKDLRGKTVLLVDDVFTTGTTAKSAALELQKAGASHIDLFTLARSDR